MSEWLDAEAHADRAFEMYERGRWAEAESELRKAISLHPDNAEWHFNLGLTLEAAGRDDDALASYRSAIELMPGEVEPLMAASAAANRLGRFEPALKLLNEVLKIDPSLEAAYAHKMEAHYQLVQHDEVETTYYLAQHTLEEPSASCLSIMADSLAERELHEKAAWCLREAMKSDPQIPRLRARLGNIFAAMGNPTRAQQMFLRDLRDDPGNIDTLLDYGELLLELGRYPDAAEKFRRVLEFEPANVDAHLKLGHIAMASHYPAQALVEYELVYKLAPDAPQIRLDLAEASLELSDVAKARKKLGEEIEFLRQSRAVQQHYAGDMTRLCRLLLGAQMNEAAVVIAEQAMERQGESIELLRLLALARYSTGDRDGGAAASRRVLRLEPRCVRSIHNLALAALEADRHRAAAGWIVRGLAIDRDDEGLRRLRAKLFITASRRFALGTIARLMRSLRRSRSRGS